MKKIGLLVDMPEGKLPGFYAQIVKGIAQRVTLFDRDKELLVLDSEADRDLVLELLLHYHIPAENMKLFLLPANNQLYAAFSDYGFTSRAENHYLYAHLIQIFKFSELQPDKADITNAKLQMDEHLIAAYQHEGITYYAVDLQFQELIERIAVAYKCTVAFIAL